MRYTIESGVRNIKSKFQKLIIGLAALAFPAALVMSSGAASAVTPPPFGLQPFTFVGAAGDCGEISPGVPYPAGTPGGVVAQWDNSTGDPAPSVLLEKNVPTADCSAAGVDVITSLEGQPVSNLTELNFDFKDGGHCGAGAPRFNLELNGSSNAFLGCNSVLGTRTPAATAGWTHVEFSQADIAAAVTTAGGLPTDTLTDLYMIFDEGNDTPASGLIGTPGQVNVDNFSVNGTTIGSPTSPVSKDDCKKGGWMNLFDNQNNPFKNQGDCVSYVATGGKNAAAGMQL